MTTTIVAAGTGATTTPLTALGWGAANESRNIFHDLLSGDVAVVLIPARPRSGDLELLYELEADAVAAVAMHKIPTTFTLTDDTRSSIGMVYAVGRGGVSNVLEDQTRDLWIVKISFQELS